MELHLSACIVGQAQFVLHLLVNQMAGENKEGIENMENVDYLERRHAKFM